VDSFAGQRGDGVRSTSVLVVDDDRRYRDLLELNLARRGYRVRLAPDGLAALSLLERDPVDLVILDLTLPDLDGHDVCGRIRASSAVPIIILSGRVGEPEKVRAFGVGADDYVTKPFAAEELFARIEAVLRRRRFGSEVIVPPALVCGDLTIDFSSRLVSRHGQPVRLTGQEYRLLRCLALDAGRVLAQAELMRRVWGPGFEEQPELLHATVRRLRRKLEDDPGVPRHLLTQRSVGYMLARG
jgi:two-component system, OmpR family, KDP operon response regulator KdpE